ncbi:MAG: hypothetical protein AAGC46_08000 [Solirubrobacteraceae bacterium]|nr:hypothetical protein [Patulibacter sp.]
MSRQAPSSTRTVLVLLTAAAFLGWMPRLRRSGSIRWHMELLQGATPIQQFAPAASAYRAFSGLHDRFDVTIIAHRVWADGPFELVPVDDRALAAWLS